MAVCGVLGEVPIIYLYGTPSCVGVERVARFVEYYCRLQTTEAGGDTIYVPDGPVQVWDGTQWTAVTAVRVSQAAVPATAVWTHRGTVRLSAHTKLCLEDGAAVEAGVLEVGQGLRHGVMAERSPSVMAYCWAHVQWEVGHFYGVFFGIGSIGKFWRKDRHYWQWELRVRSRRRTFLEGIQRSGDAYMKSLPGQSAFHIRPCGRGYWKLYTVDTMGEYLERVRQRMHTADDERCVAAEVLNGTELTQQGFYFGFTNTAGDKWVQDHRALESLEIKPAVGALGFYFVAACLGFTVTLARRQGKDGQVTYRLRMPAVRCKPVPAKKARHTSPFAVDHVAAGGGGVGRVYHITTASGQVMVGVGVCILEA